MEEWLRTGAFIGSILTSIIATGASFVFWASKRSRRVRLEQYLKAKKEKSPNELFSVTRLMADLGMTEAEIFSASVASRHVARGFVRPPDGVCHGGFVPISRRTRRTEGDFGRTF